MSLQKKTMRYTVLFLTVLGCVAATPNGYYHQEYNYKTSASSYKNNELQHQTDDQGYYKKDGDLAGRVRPRVDANSEHSEYVNPNLRNGEYNTGLIGGANGDMSSYGHMKADVGSYGTHDLSSEGLAHADNIAGIRGGAYSGSYGMNSYGSSSQSYGMSSNLRSVTSQIQQELESEIQRAIEENRAYSQSSVDFAELERELRRNVTERLNNELVNRYGQQGIRGGLSYTISGGRLHSTANYDNRELQDLKMQLENSLLNRLRSQYYQTGSRYESQQSSQARYGYPTTTVRPVHYTHYPVTYRPLTTIRPTYPVDYSRDNYVRYTPVPNPESITTIASRVQNQLDTRLNQILEDVQRRYFSTSSSYALTNTDVVIENLRNELRNNVTYLLNEEIRANYGNQIPRDGYMYTVGTNSQTSSQYNYAIRDLENLRSQIERNLIEKLNRDFERYRSRWSQQATYSQASRSSGNVQYSDYNTPRYDVYTTPRYEVYSTPRYEVYSTPQYKTYDSDVEHFSTRPSSPHIASLISSGGSNTKNRHYSMAAGTGQAGYEISNAGGSSSVSQLQRQLQQDMSRQLQMALSRNQYGSYSGSYPQSYQSSLQQLSDELNRNLTRQLQEYSASGYYSAHGNIDQAQLASMRNQLQSDLMRQLQQGLQQSYHASSSYSASSSSSSQANYRPVRGFDSNYQTGQYRSGGNVLTMDAADCVGDDPNAYSNHRMKRSYQPYRSQPIGLSYTSNSRSYPSYSSPSQSEQVQQTENGDELGQQVDDSDLTQQVEDNSSFEKLQQEPLGQQEVDLGQQPDNSDVTQQVEDSGFGKLQLGSQTQQTDLGQQVDNTDLTQQVEEPGFGKLQLGSQEQQSTDQNQLSDNSDTTQQVEDSALGKLQLGSQNQQIDLGQQVDDTDLTQQVQEPGFGKLQLGSQSQLGIDENKLSDNLDTTQQVEDSSFGKLQLGSQSNKIELGQQIDNSDLTQQEEENGKLQLGSQGQQAIDQNQLSDDLDITQQVEDSGLGKLQIGSDGQQQLGQEIDNSDLTQQVEAVDFADSQSDLQRKPQVPSILTQKTDNDDIDLITPISHNEQPVRGTAQYFNVDQDNWNSQPKLNSDNRQEGHQYDLSQQTEDSFLGGSPLQNRDDRNSQQRQHIELGQEEDNSYLTQKVENPFVDNIQIQPLPSSQIQEAQRGDQESKYPTSERQQTNPGQFQTGGSRPIYDYALNLNQPLSSPLSLTNQASIDGLNDQKLTSTNSELVQRPIDVDNNAEFGTQKQTTQPFRHFPQQITNSQTNQQPDEYSQSWTPYVSHFDDNDRSGTRPINQGNILNQQTGIPQQPVQQQTGFQPTNQWQHVPLTPPTPPRYIYSQSNPYYNKPIVSGSLQVGNRPTNMRPIDSNSFLQTEIVQQQKLKPNQDIITEPNNVNYNPNTLPSLNQVTYQQHNIPDVQQTSIHLPEKPEIATFGNLNQQVIPESRDDQQRQESIDLLPERPDVPRDTASEDVFNSRPSQIPSLGQNTGDLNKPNSYSQTIGPGNYGSNGLTSPNIPSYGYNGYISSPNVISPNRFRPGQIDNSYEYGSNLNKYGTGYSTNELNFGQQQSIPDTEVVSSIQPIKPQQPTVVQNVEPQVSNYNIGVKGRRSRPRMYSTSIAAQQEIGPPAEASPIYQPEVVQAEKLQPEVSQPQVPQLEVSQSSVPQPESIEPVKPSSSTQEITELDETSPTGTQENLPWWKRFGNKGLEQFGLEVIKNNRDIFSRASPSWNQTNVEP
ncbi:hypothetical protein NQ315_012096 [Exocentrus adspersus]|uniref:Uncharacterized protein n=1 Tax=Exocentrus adspersus TaxID=1586481 RepID=A0AAV8VXM6_9CUCU|nr:hypothetical protein NQ315_012096 [Exocentrus adspersus]